MNFYFCNISATIDGMPEIHEGKHITVILNEEVHT